MRGKGAEGETVALQFRLLCISGGFFDLNDINRDIVFS